MISVSQVLSQNLTEKGDFYDFEKIRMFLKFKGFNFILEFYEYQNELWQKNYHFSEIAFSLVDSKRVFRTISELFM